MNTENKFKHDLSTLRKFVDHQRSVIATILEEESINIKATLDQLQENMKLISMESYLDSSISPEEVKCEISRQETGDIEHNTNVTAEVCHILPVNLHSWTLLIASHKHYMHSANF